MMSGQLAFQEQPIVVRQDQPSPQYPGADSEGYMFFNRGHKFISEKGRKIHIRDILGKGGFGIVFLCHIEGHSENFALKVSRLQSDFCNAAKREYEAMYNLNDLCCKMEGVGSDSPPLSPGNGHYCQTVHCIECFRYHEHICILTYAYDYNLLTLMNHYFGQSARPFPIPFIRRVIANALLGLQSIHRIGYVHTDIKPENILFDLPYNNHSAGRILHPPQHWYLPEAILCDFGSVWHTSSSRKPIVATTKAYRAPEVSLRCDWSYAVDIWSLGVIMAEMMIGRSLFDTHETSDTDHLVDIQMVVGKKINLSQMGTYDEEIADAYLKTDNFFPSVPPYRKSYYPLFPLYNCRSNCKHKGKKRAGQQMPWLRKKRAKGRGGSLNENNDNNATVCEEGISRYPPRKPMEADNTFYCLKPALSVLTQVSEYPLLHGLGVSLCLRMLSLDPKDRPLLDDIFKDPFFKGDVVDWEWDSKDSKNYGLL